MKERGFRVGWGYTESKMKIPAISGAEKAKFDSVFPKGAPPVGSIGVYWHLYKDLRTMTREQLASQKTNRVEPRKPEEGTIIPTTHVTFLRLFYEFGIQDVQPYFFIKKGTRPQWLVRKVGSYYYDDTAIEAPHRIAFEFVRNATEEEGRAHTGIGIKTIFMMEVELDNASHVTVPLSQPKVVVTVPKLETSDSVVEMPPRKATTAVTKATTASKATTAPKAILTPYLEMNEDPLIVEELEIIKTVPLDYKGTLYRKDPLSNKIYLKHVCVGIWDTKAERITPI